MGYKMTSIVYKITNKTTNKKYIGWTNKSSVEERWKVHLQCANRGEKTHLYNAIRLYGPEDFLLEELEKGEDDKYMLNEREPYWIKQFDISELYNMTQGGEGGTTSTSWKPGAVPWSKGKKLDYVSEMKKEYWEKWRKENPNYKNKWKKYNKKGISIEDREKRRERALERNSKNIVCPHCGKTGNIGNMKRWHFKNCKMRK